MFFSVILGSFSLGNALPEIETIATALGAATVVFEIIDRVRGHLVAIVGGINWYVLDCVYCSTGMYWMVDIVQLVCTGWYILFDWYVLDGRYCSTGMYWMVYLVRLVCTGW